MKFNSLLWIAFAGTAWAGDVVDLKTDQFDDFVKDNSLALIEFFAPWCGHCKALAPQFEVAASELKSEGIALAKVDCTEEGDLCSKFEIAGYPTLKIFRGEDDVSDYRGMRDSADIVTYMKRQALPAVSDVDSKSVKNFLGLFDASVIGFFSDKDKEARASFDKLAGKFRETMGFGVTTDKKLASQYKVKSPAVVVVKKEDEPATTTDLAYDALEEFVNIESIPKFGELAPENFQQYAGSGIPLLYAFVSSLEEKETVKSYFEPVIKTLRGKANFAFLNASLYGSHASQLNLEQIFPCVVIHDMETNRRYSIPQTEDLSAKNVAQFVKDYVGGKLESVLKSASVPETQDGPVYILTGKEYHSVVVDNDKDVLVEFYAPWCGHCKNLAPIYDKLGFAYKDSDKVTIAKLNHEDNEAPVAIQGYPTILLFPAGKKDAPITYRGSRTLEDLAKFVEENGTNKAAADFGTKYEPEEHDEL